MNPLRDNLDDTPAIVGGDCSRDLVADIMRRIDFLEKAVFELEFEVASVRAHTPCVPVPVTVTEVERTPPPSPRGARLSIKEPLVQQDLEKRKA